MKRACWITAFLTAVSALVVGLMWWLSPGWPDFPLSASKEPHVVVRTDRDYAYHIGDLVAVELFVRQTPGTTVDPSSLSVGGDFELSNKPQVSEKKLLDGSLCHRIYCNIQSFKAKPQLVLIAKVNWQDSNRHWQELSIPQTSLFTSNTWDGRQKLQEGDNPRVPAYWYTLRHALPLSVASLVFATLLVVAVRNHLRLQQLTANVDRARNRVTELLETLKASSCERQEHLELDGLMRDHFTVGPIPATQLDPKLISSNLVEFLKLNAIAIYAKQRLDETGNTALYQLGQKLLGEW